MTKYVQDHEKKIHIISDIINNKIKKEKFEFNQKYTY